MSFIKRFSTLQLALGFSLLVHAALITVRFVDPEGFNRVFKDTPLEVILVNARSSAAPPEAQAIAQANLTGGGEVDRGRATSPLPPSPTTAAGNAEEESQRQLEQLQQAQQQLLAQLQREMAVLPPPDPKQDKGTPQETALEDKRRKLVELLAEIEKRINEENSRPKKRFVSPATREESYAQYYDQLRRKIEERGTRNFPTHQGRKLYGELTMNVTINAAGRVIDTEIVRASNSKTLDRQAMAIVNAASPFGPFSAKMLVQADQLVITSRFRFSREDGLEAIPLGSSLTVAPASP
jgi:periplasmic protein TonB